MAEILVPINDSSLAFLQDYSARNAKGIYEQAGVILEQFLQEQEELNKLKEIRAALKRLSEKSTMEVGKITWTREELYES